MKKLVSLLIAIVLLCSALVGCGYFENLLKPSEENVPTKKKVNILPSERDPMLDELELDYTDNFDEYDVEFIKTMRYEYLPGRPGYDYRPNFVDAMKCLSVETDTFYKLNIDVQSPLYFISVYENPGIGGYFLELGGIVEWVKWCKYEEYNDIPSEIDGYHLLGSYGVYDCVLEKDILNDVIYNVPCKYYVALANGYEESGNMEKYNLYETASWLDLSKLFGRTTPLTIFHTANHGYYYSYSPSYPYRNHIPGKDIYEYYIDENGVEYLNLGFSNNPKMEIQSIVDEYWQH